MKPRRARILTGFALIGILSFVAVRTSVHGPERFGPIIVTFNGYTNDASGSRLASFIVSNSGTVTIRAFNYHAISDLGETIHDYSTSTFKPPIEVQPGQVRTVYCPKPKSNQKWSYTIFYANYDLQQRLVETARSLGVPGIVPNKWKRPVSNTGGAGADHIPPQ